MDISTMKTSLRVVSLWLTILTSCSSQRWAPTSPPHDWSCVVPPAPVNNITGNQLVSLTVQSPWFPDPAVDRIRETLYYTQGHCGIDVFVLEKGMIFDSLIPVGFNNYCRKSDPLSQTDMPQVNILAAGSSNGGIAPTLMPWPRRLPAHWRSGIIIWIHYDRVVAEPKPFHITCSYPYNNLFGARVNVVLIVNATLTVNGCPMRKYGANCDLSCDYCAEGINCNGFTGVCICPKGFVGHTCGQATQGVRVNTNDMYIPFGDSANMTCSSHGFISVTSKWTRGGALEPSVTYFEDVTYTPRPRIMYITIVASDTSVDGVYICTMTDPMGKVYMETVNVTVIGIPDAFVEFPFSQEVTSGSDVSFRCSVKELTGRIKWFRGEYSFPRNSTKVVTQGRRHIINHSPLTSELFIRDVRVEDEDVYKCFVGYVFTERDLVYAQARLTVFVPTKSGIEGYREGEIITHRELTPLQLVCRAGQTKPAPRVTWFIGDMVRTKGVFTDTIQSYDGMTFNITSTLHMAPVWRQNTNIVRCVMENMAMGEVSQTSVGLNIIYTPKVRTPGRISVVIGGKLTIECLASANPATMEYEWTIQSPNGNGNHGLTPLGIRNITGSDIPNDQTEVGGQFDGNVYTVEQVTEDHNDLTVICTVYNTMGQGSSETHIKVTEQQSGMSLPVIGIAIMGALGLLGLVVIVQCCRRHVRKFCSKNCFKEDDAQDEMLMDL